MPQVPFTRDEFFHTFSTYNLAVWPMQWFLLALALGVMYVAFRARHGGRRAVFGFLTLLWAWTGGVYHLQFFTRINPVAYGFGVLFLIQSALFAHASFRTKGLVFDAHRHIGGLVGVLLVGYALVLSPLLGRMAGHAYPAAPTFGTPCPTTIFTFGILMWSCTRFPLHLLAIPLAWALFGSTAALFWGVTEDLMMPVAGIIATLMMVRRNRLLARREAAERPRRVHA